MLNKDRLSHSKITLPKLCCDASLSPSLAARHSAVSASAIWEYRFAEAAIKIPYASRMIAPEAPIAEEAWNAASVFTLVQPCGGLFHELRRGCPTSNSYGFRLLRAGRTPCHPGSTSAPPILNAHQQRGRFQLGERLLQCISPATVPACRETPVLFSLMFSLSYTLDFAGLFAGRNTCS